MREFDKLIEYFSNEIIHDNKDNILEELKSLYEKHSLYELFCKKYNCDIDNIEKNEELTKKRMLEVAVLMNHLTEAGISFVILKGAYLAQQAYGSIGLRSFNDIDLLIDRKDVNKVIKVCKDNGYVEGKYIPEKKRFKNIQIIK